MLEWSHLRFAVSICMFEVINLPQKCSLQFFNEF